MDAQFYSLQKLPVDLKLLGDPYHSKEAREHLFNLGVVFYRDSENGWGILKKGTEGGQLMYYSAGIFTDDTYEIDEWLDAAEFNEDEPQENEDMQQTFDFTPAPQAEKGKKAWLAFNERYFILSIDRNAVKRA